MIKGTQRYNVIVGIVLALGVESVEDAVVGSGVDDAVAIVVGGEEAYVTVLVNEEPGGSRDHQRRRVEDVAQDGRAHVVGVGVVVLVEGILPVHVFDHRITEIVGVTETVARVRIARIGRGGEPQIRRAHVRTIEGHHPATRSGV